MLTVDQYARIRQLRREGCTLRQIAEQLKHSPKTIFKALANPEPPATIKVPPRAAPVFGPFRSIVDAIVAADDQAPPKQRHSGMQIFRRLVAEHGYRGQYDQIRRHLQARSLARRETFIPLDHPPGHRCEADFGHIHVDFPEARKLVPVLVVTWSYFQGLVNVSGFHVDPGFRGPLKFAVYNAGSRDITLDQDERVFMLWFADLNEDAPDPYGPVPSSPSIITSKDVDKLKGEVASPGELKKQVDDIKHDYDKRLQSVELRQTILQWLACAAIVLFLGTMLRAGWFDRAIELANRSGAAAPANPPAAGAPVAPTPAMVPDHLGYYILGAGGIAGLCSIVAAFIVRKRLEHR